MISMRAHHCSYVGKSDSRHWRKRSRSVSSSSSARREMGSASRELEMWHLWSRNGSRQLEPVQVVAEAVEQPPTTAEENRNKSDIRLVDEVGLEVLLRGLGAARERYVLVSRCGLRLRERRLDAGGDEREGRSSLECERLARVMCEHEHGMMIRR